MLPPTVTTADGLTIAVHELGGDGPPLIMAHATGFHGLVFGPLARLLKSDFHCVTIDERGHGDSARPSQMKWHGFALDVLATVDVLDAKLPFGVGHSAGGAALLLAEQTRPGTFRALYCFEPIVFPPSASFPVPSDNPLSQSARRRRELFDSREDAFANFASKPPFDQLDAEALHAYVDHGFEDVGDGRVRLKCLPETEAETYEEAPMHDAFEHLPEVDCPVTVARGASSDTFTDAMVDALVERLPRGRAEVVADVGHFGPLEDPAALARSIRSAFGAA